MKLITLVTTLILIFHSSSLALTTQWRRFPVIKTVVQVFGLLDRAEYGEVEPYSRPFQVMIRVDNESTYSGSLISQNYVLTTGHTIFNSEVCELFFGIHDLDLDLEDESTKIVITNQWTIHPEFSYDTDEGLFNDIALIELPEPITFNDHIQPISLPSSINEQYEGEKVFLSGWGNNDPDDTVLKGLELEIISNGRCESKLNRIIRYSLMCTSGADKAGGCEERGGAPLTHNGILIGILSYSSYVCDLGKPSVFTRISAYLDWIEENSDVNITRS